MLERIKGLFRRRREEDGQGLVEYGLILGLIAVVAIAALNATGRSINTLIQKVAASLSTVS